MARSRTEPASSSKRTLWVTALVALGALCGILVLASAAQAQPSINEIQTYTWSEEYAADSDSDSVSLDQTWIEIPHDDTQVGADTELARDGFALVAIDYAATGADRIHFDWVRNDEVGDSNPTRFEYTFTIDPDTGARHDPVSDSEQNVFLARNVSILNDAGDGNETTGADACGGTAGHDLRAGTDTETCWFFIEIPNENDGNLPSTGESYVLEVEIEDDDGVTAAFERTTDGERRPITMEDTDVTVDEQITIEDGLVSGASTTTVEAGDRVLMNLTLATGDSSSARSTQDGDVDAWVCVFRSDQPSDPWTGFDQLRTLNEDVDDADEPVPCEVMDHPAREGIQPVDANAVPLTPTSGPGERSSDLRHFEASFTIGRDEIHMTSQAFIDTFDFRFIARDAIGNFLIVDADDANNPSPIDIGRYQVDQKPIDLGVGGTESDLTVTDFLDNDGCFQPDDGGATRAADNSGTNPCFRAVNYAPSDQTFTFPVVLENYGNLEDDVVLDWIDTDEDGETDWNVELFYDGSTATDSISVTVPAGEPRQAGPASKSQIKPGTATVEVRITPTSGSQADILEPGDDATFGYYTTRFDVESGRSDAIGLAEPSWHLQAKLVQNARGRIAFLEDSSEVRTTSVEMGADARREVTVKITNTGNTNGPFHLRIDRSTSPGECNGINQAAEEDEIGISLRDDTGSRVPGETITPGQSETFTLRFDTGTSIPVGDYGCVFDLKPFPGSRTSGDDDPVSLITTQPTTNVKVTGTPDIKIWEARGADFDQFNVTGENITLTVPPSGDVHEVYLYLENVGDVALQPELVSPSEGTFLQKDAFDLGGTWLGVNETNGQTLSRSSAAAPFSLPVSDQSDTDQVLIRDLFNPSTRQPTSEVDSPGDPWLCSGEDAATDDDQDERIVCQMHWRFDVAVENPVAGDQVVYRFTYADANGAGDPSQVTVRLNFQHVGTVETESVTEKVLGDGDSTDVQLSAELSPATRFDPDASQIRGTADLALDGADCSGSATVLSTQESLRSASFRPTITYTHDAQASGCSVSQSSPGDDIVVTGPAGDLTLRLAVTDDNGSQLRQVHPVHLTVQSSSPGTVQDPSSFEIFPREQINASGSQWASVEFDPGNQGDDFPAANEGLLLSRKTAVDALEPFPSCTLDGLAIASDESPLKWTLVEETDPGLSSVPYEDNSEQRNNVIDADRVIAGTLLQNEDQTDTDQAVRAGNITLWGWGDGSQITWREGWNPLAMRLVDEDGDPARGPDSTSAPDVELELRFVVRDANGQITDSYELSTGTDTINVDNRGNGLYSVDIYLPATVSQNDGVTLGDYSTTRDVQTSEVYYEAFGMHARINTGQSTGGEDLRGDAYWQLADLGMITDSDGARDDEQGSVGTSTIKTGTGPFKAREQLTEGTIGPDDTGEFLHGAVKFLSPLMTHRAPSQGGNWVTGPGVQDYGVFLMEERSDPQDGTNTFGENNATDGFREHTFQTYQNAQVDLTVIGQSRVNLPGGDTYTLSADEEITGLYSDFFVLPDTGIERFPWLTELVIGESSGDGEFFTFLKTFETDAGMEPSVNGLPMPLCLREPANAPGGDTTDEPAGDFDTAQFGSRKIVDLRTVPGLLVDRGGFAMAPLVSNSQGGVSFQINDGGTFQVLGQGLLSLDAGQVPTTGEVGVPISLSISPKPASAVKSVEADLTKDGSNVDAVTLTDTDGDGSWTGSVTPDDAGDHVLSIVATDTTGSPSLVEKTVNVTENAPPRISIDAPSKTNGTRAMSPNGSIRATVTDRSITASAITLEEKVGSDDGQQGQALEADNVTLDGLLSRDTVGDKSVTLSFPNHTGTAYVNITGLDATQAVDTINGSSIDSNGEVTGRIKFNATGTATITVQTNGADGVDQSFTVDVVESSSDGFSTVSLGSDAINCEATSCTVTHSPSGLSDGDTYQVRITAEISADDKTTKGPVSVEIDGTAPTVSVAAGSPKVSGTPTIVGSGTPIEVTSSDNVGIGSITLRGISGGSETGAVTLTGSSGSATISELGLGDTGSATIEVNVTDVAGNEATDSLSVQVDGSGPRLSGRDVSQDGGSLVATIEARDAASVDTVTLFVRKPGDTRFTSQTMTSGTGNVYEATITQPGSSGNLAYYFKATDGLGNANALGDQSNPFSLDLGGFNLTNTAPTVDITAPSDGASVSGTIDLVLSTSDPDGDTVTIESARATPSSGNPVSLDVSTGETTIQVDTTQLAEGRADLEVEVSDGRDTASDSISVIVNNLPDAGPCPGRAQLTTGTGQAVCFNYPSENVTSLEVSLIRNGETVTSKSMDPQANGTYRTTFDFEEGGSYALRITAEKADGTTEETTSEPFQVQSLVDTVRDAPLGRFITTLVLGVVVVGLAGFAAFGRWN